MIKDIDITKWINNLKTPSGIDAQLTMAPELRVKELEEYNNSTQNSHESAVLVLIYFDKELKLLLTLRSEKLTKHGGQVSFPGGKKDKEDTNLEQTALREAWEEVGIEAQNLTLIGELSPIMIPITGFKIIPFVAISQHRPIFNINRDEVDRIIEAPISHLLDPKFRKLKVFSNPKHQYSRQAPYFDIEGVEVWGATAMIISELLGTLFIKK